MNKSSYLTSKQTKPFAKAKSPLIKGSVQKVNLCLKLLRGKTILEALNLLERMQKEAAKEVRKTLLSAVSNAEQQGIVDIDELYVSNISASKAVQLRRYHTRARGRIFSVQKHYSRVYIELNETGNI